MEYLIIVVALLLALALWANLMPVQCLNAIMLIGRKASGMRLRRISVEGVDWPYLEGGVPDADVVLLVHGFAADKDSWTVYARQLRKHFRVIIPDLPGHGEHVKDVSLDYSVEVQTDRLAKFVSAIGVDKCHVVGNSMGGHISLLFAANYPAKTQSLTLINNAGILLEEKNDITAAVDAGENPLEMKSPEDVSRQLALVMYKPVYLPGFMKRALYARAQADKPVLDKIFWEIVETTESLAMNNRLDQISAPTLIIWGRHDQIVDLSTVDILEQGIEGARSVVIEEAGHVPMAEKPAETAKHHLAFLANVKTNS